MTTDDHTAAVPLSRRQFLRTLSMLAGAACTAPLARALAEAPPSPPLHVIVVGAGLAGLCAAYELEQRGHTVTVLEGSDRLGGRVRTARFADGLYGELGAMRIPPGHDLTRRYISQFGLPTRPFVQSNPNAYYFLRGHRERIKDLARLKRLYGLGEWEGSGSIGEYWEKAVTRRIASLGDKERKDLFAETPASGAVRELDDLTVAQLCRRAGLSEEATELLLVCTGEEMLMHGAATEDIREEVRALGSGTFHEIVGGNDLLPRAFALRFRSQPKLCCEVVGLEQDPERWAAALYRSAEAPGRTLRVQGDLLLCTVPFPVLQRFSVTPPFSPPKQRAIRQLNYEASTKVLLLTRRRFWEGEDGIYGGGTFTDLPTGMTYYPSDNAAGNPAVSAGKGVLLASYTWGQAARRLGTLPEPERSAQVVRHLSSVHPQLASANAVLQTQSCAWENCRWSGGAFAWFMPGQHAALQKDVCAAQGRIHFAGEHTTLTHAWMQGALESALRAVREMEREELKRGGR